MNKKEMIKQLNEIGIKVKSFNCTQRGYCLKLELNIVKATGWEKLEQLNFEGLEIAIIKKIDEYTKQVWFIPNNRKEFNDYIIAHIKEFGLRKPVAWRDLRFIVDTFGSTTAKLNFSSYKNK